jgi:NTP pyrophosphatase (non-canonical NTP hydrolase)
MDEEECPMGVGLRTVIIKDSGKEIKFDNELLETMITVNERFLANNHKSDDQCIMVVKLFEEFGELLEALHRGTEIRYEAIDVIVCLVKIINKSHLMAKDNFKEIINKLSK